MIIIVEIVESLGTTTDHRILDVFIDSQLEFMRFQRE